MYMKITHDCGDNKGSIIEIKLFEGYVVQFIFSMENRHIAYNMFANLNNCLENNCQFDFNTFKYFEFEFKAWDMITKFVEDNNEEKSNIS